MVFKLSRFACGLALGFIASAAHAETIDLFCQESGATGANGLNVSLDMTSSTAVAWASWASRQDVPVSQATITDDQVTWGRTGNIDPQYTLNRKSGVLIELSPNRMGGPFAVSTSLTCKKDTPLF